MESPTFRMNDRESSPLEAASFDGPAPLASGERIASIDVLRGFSLFGILWMNIVAFALPGAAYGDPTIAGGAHGADLVFWFVSQVLVEGKMRTIFSLLFGAGVVLLTTRAEGRGAGVLTADIYYRRTIWLIVFGLLHAYLIWSGDILYGYGVAALFLFPFRKQTPRFLIIAGLLLLAIIVPKSILEGRRIASLRAAAAAADALAARGTALTDEQREAQADWDNLRKDMKPSPAEIASEIADHRAGYWTLFPRRMDEVYEGESKEYYRFGFFDVAGMMLIGMGLVKLGLFSAARSRRFYVVLGLLGYGIGLPINIFMANWNLAHRFDPAEMFVGFSGYDIGRLAVALGHVVVVMLICRSGHLRGATARLAAVGRMALTNYLGTSLVCVLLFEGFGLGLYGRLGRAQLLFIVLPVWLAQAILSPFWLRRFRYGPMEWLWRSLTYWSWLPMRRLSGTETVPRSAHGGAESVGM
jgi:uncharacterized protein